ncbi:MAG TPA: S8 family serine peptidase [Mycobacteriales bacterium]|nr:S8 family serine peptidase [Mycobacteriales bacterium]
MRAHLTTPAARGSARRAVAVAAVLGAAAFAMPMHASGSTGGTSTSSVGSGLVRAVVLVRPGVHLPLQVPGGRVVQTFSHVGSELVRAPMSALAALARDVRVAGVSPDRAGRVDTATYSNTGGILAPVAVGGNAGKKGVGYHVNVALLDTGLTDTPALNRASGRITDGVDVSRLAKGGDARTSGKFTDGYGHGTFLATLIAGGAEKPGGPVIGIAPAARIVVVKVADDRGRTTLSEVLAGMDWVAAHARAIQVVNLALSVARPTAPAYGADPLTAAVEHVRAAGVLAVVAAGNNAKELGDPGMDPQALTIGAADVTGTRPTVASFSGRGTVDGVVKPDVVAPGVHMLGVMPSGTYIYKNHPEGRTSGGLFKGSGTSEATAVASGVAAAYYSTNLDATPKQAKAAVRDAAQAMHKSGSGKGLVRMVGAAGAKAPESDAGESHFNATAWNDNAWQGGNWADWLASSWSASSWSASSWSASSWSASSWSASSWSASSWSASSWSASSWSASSWSASSWSASSWSTYGWGNR